MKKRKEVQLNTLNAHREENSAANRMMYVFLLAGLTPLLVILLFYVHNPETPLLYSIAASTAHLPAYTSAYNPIMTKVMDVYCKSAPLLAIILFFCSLNKRKFNYAVNRDSLIRSCLFGPFLYFAFIYLLLFWNLELTTAGRPVRLMAKNNVTLLLFYMGQYYAVFLMTYAVCYIPIISYQFLKKRR
ncbi:colicin immunity protein Cui [Erwinia psidii]|uniref:Colicin-A n=1 Tax=Erwinia psidii TaxID=69224 RepID=A0A3N6RWV9_9GAMM|nr:colicin immunity protein Cui [Erwinia psidii]MCX8957183.1 colicin-A [Erwinia psidii]MCX8961835.1 colicin-A [Erwinia psidii]MCX8965429.1 colicin-A [Erwinia psidii]RQM37564.1 colicin-A [Erwinia psidii]